MSPCVSLILLYAAVAGALMVQVGEMKRGICRNLIALWIAMWMVKGPVQ